MNQHPPSHGQELVRLRRIEGQVRGIQQMIEDGRYCVDILTQLRSISGALARVQENILDRHLHSCVQASLSGSDGPDRTRKVEEIIDLLSKFRRSGS
jgi:CsoR family transcriptional regulator, copper-sensing transcriptional repressor